ncbi:MAG: transcription-repair coupling factor, partial [Acidimicrobiales bacterium]
MSPPLRPLPGLLHDEPALTQVLGRSSAVLAVPEPARAVVVAAISRLSSRTPIVVAVPTSGDADRLAADLGAFLGEDEVELFPAWETLPFERVSPGVEVMGRRLRVMWHLRHGGRIDAAEGERGRGAPKVVVAPVRALVQRLGPHVEDVEPIIVGHGDQLDPAQLVADLVAGGYRREELVEHRGEVAVRGSIGDVFPSPAAVPIRIDHWGDEVDRLTQFSVSDQRSTIDLAEVEIFPCRELLPTDEVRARAEKLMASDPWGREQWERLSGGLTFDGMESWLPWLTEGEHTLFDLLD